MVKLVSGENLKESYVKVNGVRHRVKEARFKNGSQTQVVPFGPKAPAFDPQVFLADVSAPQDAKRFTMSGDVTVYMAYTSRAAARNWQMIGEVIGTNNSLIGFQSMSGNPNLRSVIRTTSGDTLNIIEGGTQSVGFHIVWATFNASMSSATFGSQTHQATHTVNNPRAMNQPAELGLYTAHSTVTVHGMVAYEGVHESANRSSVFTYLAQRYQR